MSKLRRLLAADAAPADTAAAGSQAAAAGDAAGAATSTAEQLAALAAARELDAAFNAAFPVGDPAAVLQQQMQLFATAADAEYGEVRGSLISNSLELGLSPFAGSTGCRAAAVLDNLLDRQMRGTVHGRINVAAQQVDDMNVQDTEAALTNLPALCGQAAS